MQDPANKHRILYLNVWSELITHRIYNEGICIKQWTNWNDEETHEKIAKQVKEMEEKKKAEQEAKEKEAKAAAAKGGKVELKESDAEEEKAKAPMAPWREVDEEADEEWDRMHDIQGSNFWGKEKVVVVTWRHDEEKTMFGGCLVVGKGSSMMDAFDWD